METHFRPRSLQFLNGFSSNRPEREAGWNRTALASAPTRFTTIAPVSAVRSAKMARLEAVLFVTGSAITPKRLSQHATLADAKEAKALIEQLNDAYDATGSSFRVERVAAGFQLMTRREFAPWLDRIHHRQAELKLSPAQMETLTIVAYRQPITRADVEAIRGVASAEMLKQLMERSLVRIGGEDDSLGRPYLYVTTRRFLEIFGMQKLADLPMAKELRLKRAKPGTDQETLEHSNEVTEDDDPDAESEDLESEVGEVDNFEADDEVEWSDEEE